MIYLIFVSIIWGFSFGLIKNQLAGLDANFVSFIRLSLAFLIFLPWLKIKSVRHHGALLFIGAVQFGLMYIAYIFSYRYLQAYQVALFTIFTPIYIALIDDLLTGRFNKLHFLVAFVAVLGTGIILWNQALNKVVWLGFVLVQISNVCFALGQILYRKYRGRKTRLKNEVQIFALLYLGAVIITGGAAFFTTDWAHLTLRASQWLTFVYLGVVASGIGFFLWNFGATKVNAGSLAVFNNLKIPMAIFIALIFFGEHVHIGRLLVGGGLIVAALWYNEKKERGKASIEVS